MSNEKVIRMVYAALELKHLAFKMYKNGDSTFFMFDGNIIEVNDSRVYFNAEKMENLNDVYKAMNKQGL
mgnify:FL=1